MSLLISQQAFSKDVIKLLEFIGSKGYGFTFGEAYRTPEQAKLYAQEGKGIVDSLHCQRLAIDLNLLSPSGIYLTDTASYSFLGAYWESLNTLNRWGGNFPRADGNHFERKDS